jgi:pyridoxamine 5'-phosphate oxidase
MTLLADMLPETLPQDPLPLAASWLAEAWARRDQPNPNAMTLATVDATGRPSARIVLCKDIVADAGYVAFYTNYHSRKGRELADNPRAAIVLHWDHMHRQVRIEGTVMHAPASDSDAYFESRPWQRRIGAWASEQSEPVGSHAELQRAVVSAAQRFGAPLPGPEDDPADPGIPIPRPPHWGGYRLWIDAVELWVEGESRIHDRARWQRTLLNASEASGQFGRWTATRLQP